ncbi:hypothetical protein ASNO1_44560 [Corallococcus caeni]|uniref:Lipoprotein n=1 Tax=Corallococcus caeni TaxID=3082388 RepID=A0ABQ6QY17_9BACT|nr:hypothetical protein ASNO1_44560 [Corallococcus sp. NO1]
MRIVLFMQYNHSRKDRRMRAAILAGLMTVGLMVACGGSGVPEVTAQAENCADCLHELQDCLRRAGSRPAAIEACQAMHDDCYAEMCGGLSVANEESSGVTQTGLPPDNICYVECWGGSAAGTTAAAYAASLQVCFDSANSICAVADGGWYGLSYNGQHWAN